MNDATRGAGLADEIRPLAAERLFDLSGRSAIVTGGGSGLGRAIAAALAANGARITIAGLDAGRLAETASALSAGAPGRVGYCVADIMDDQAIARLVETAEERLGPADILVNAAGIARREASMDMARADFARVIAVNVEGAFAVSQAVARRMADTGQGGSIVNIGSFLYDRAMRNVASYAASKAALHQVTRSLALEWSRHAIRVNEIMPGWFPTEMTEPFLGGRAGAILAQTNPLRRLGGATDIAGAALLLCSDAGAYMTGASIAIDGGQSLV